MKTKIEDQKSNELELARLFEVEELEDRMEFGSWAPVVEGSGTYTPGVGTEYDMTLGVAWIPFK